MGVNLQASAMKHYDKSEDEYGSYMSGERSYKITHQAVVVPASRRYFAGDTMKRIIRNTGVECVRRDEKWDSVHLAVEAVNQLLRMSAINKDRVKHLVFVTQTPRHRYPANNHLILEECGLWDAAGLDMTQSCSGYMHGLYVLHRLMGKGEVGILVCADTIARNCRPGDTSTNFLFSDAASATLVVQGGEFPWEFDIASIPSSFPALREQEGYLKMDGMAIIQAAAALIPKMLRPFMEVHTYARDVYLHQANATILDMIERKLPEGRRYPRCLATHGNASSASIPLLMTLDKPTGHVLACGFGGGFHAVAGYLGKMDQAEMRLVEV